MTVIVPIVVQNQTESYTAHHSVRLISLIYYCHVAQRFITYLHCLVYKDLTYCLVKVVDFFIFNSLSRSITTSGYSKSSIWMRMDSELTWGYAANSP
jgi:hypothetical protein